MGTKTPTYLEKLKAEQDELAAELERWETNFSHAMDTANDIYEQKLEVLAELERVKAEHRWATEFLSELGIVFRGKDGVLSAFDSTDEYMLWIGSDEESMDPVDLAKSHRQLFASELSSLKSRLPVNADGDVVLWGDEVWYWDPVENKPMGGKCHSFECLVGEGEFEIGVFVKVIDVTQDLYNSELFTTAESCRAAHEGKEGENDE